MTYQTLFMMAAMGFILVPLILFLDHRARTRALQRYERQRARMNLVTGYTKAEMMVQHRNLTHEQRVGVLNYIDLLERQHRVTHQPSTYRFDRLRKTLTLNSRGAAA